MKIKVDMIDITPTWLDMCNVIEALLVDGDAKGRATAREELRRMARAADAYNAAIKEKGTTDA